MGEDWIGRQLQRPSCLPLTVVPVRRDDRGVNCPIRADRPVDAEPHYERHEPLIEALLTTDEHAPATPSADWPATDCGTVL